MTTFEITMRHSSIPQTLEGHVADKISKLEKHLRGRSPRIEIILDRDHEDFKCEMIVHDTAGSTPPIVARTTSGDPAVSIDLAIDKVRHQLVKLNERRHDHHRGSRTSAGSEPTAPRAEGDEPTYEDIVQREVKGK